MIMASLPIQASRTRTGALCTRTHAGACSLGEITEYLPNLRSKSGTLPERAKRARVVGVREGVGGERENLSLYISLEREKERSRENTLRTRVHAHARGDRKEAGQKTRAGRKTRDARHEGWEDHKEEP